MIELNVKASNYAEENVINALKETFAKAYADGYRDGYKDREEETPVALCDKKTEFVDLGLPSGTLWSTDYERDDNEIILLPHEKSSHLQIPSAEQWEELKNTCQWEFDTNGYYSLLEARCVGPNGNVLKFDRTGKKNISTFSNTEEVFFWVKDGKKGNEKNAVHIYSGVNRGQAVIEDFYSGYKLPIRLVRKK